MRWWGRNDDAGEPCELNATINIDCMKVADASSMVNGNWILNIFLAIRRREKDTDASSWDSILLQRRELVRSLGCSLLLRGWKSSTPFQLDTWSCLRYRHHKIECIGNETARQPPFVRVIKNRTNKNEASHITDVHNRWLSKSTTVTRITYTNTSESWHSRRARTQDRLTSLPL